MNANLDSPVLVDGDSHFRALVTRLRPSALKPGDLAVAENVRMDESGTAKVREGYQNVSGVILTTTVTPFLRSGTGTDALVMIGSRSSCTGADQGDGTIRIDTLSAHGIPLTGAMVNLASFTATDINGNREATYVDATHFDVTVSGASGAYSGGVVGSHKMTGGAVAIYGACRWSDPGDSNADYIIIADNETATAVKLSDKTTTVIDYPATTISSEVQLQQEFGVVMLRRDGYTWWEWDAELDAVASGAFVVDRTYTIATLGNTNFVAIGASATEVGVIFTATGMGSGSGTARSAFTKVSTGTYTQPMDLSANATIDTAGKCAMNVAGHGLSTGDKVTVVDPSTSGLTSGDEFIVTVSDVNNFIFYANVKSAAITPDPVVVRHRVSVGGGFIHPPASRFATYHQRRVWTPYTHDSAENPATRNVHDEIVASDILDGQSFDPVYNQFKITAGTSDFIVGIQPFDDDRLLVFNRNTIHYLTGVSGSLNDVRTIQLSDEIGCVARKSIVTHSNQVFFLSDSGLFAISFRDTLTLRGTDIPLSEAIESEVRRITPSAADGAVAVYHDNRLWLAVPTDGSLVNNEIWCFSFLNGAWESIDTVNAPNWGVVDLIPARSGKINELYAVTVDGGVHQLDQTNSDRDKIASAVGATGTTSYSIPARVRTRGYSHGTIERKRFNMLEAHIKSDSGYVSDGSLSIVTEDPDSTSHLGTLIGLLGGTLARSESASIRRRTGNVRGFSAQLEWTPTVGRPELRAVGIRATSTMNSATSTT